MSKFNFLFFLLFSCIPASGQQTVSGYIDLEEPYNGEQSIYLMKLVLADQSNNQLIATANVREDGFFAFEEAVFTEQDEIYRLMYKNNTSDKNSKVSETSSRPFIISHHDSLFFPKDALNFASYTTSSKSDEEWQKLKKHEANSESDISLGSEHYLKETREYTKDSLQILLVKLLSIKTLDQQKLLEKDIRENADYYLDFLMKLQKSDLPPASYASLENKIRKAHQNILQRRYYTSLAVNGIGFLAIAGLLYLVFRLGIRRKLAPEITLSKQEENIKTLILEGRTNKEIAGELYISISTVKTHITNIYSKLNISSRKELMLKS